MIDSLIPRPVRMKITEGIFFLRPEARILACGPRSGDLAGLLAEYLRPATGFSLPVLCGSDILPGDILLQSAGANPPDETGFANEHYQLFVRRDQVLLTGDNAESLARGIQTFRQLFPPEIYTMEVRKQEWQIPCVEIEDESAFRWRGMMLDAARHFFSKNEICRMIELFAQHKINVVHLHLTDDQGWRVEIKKYPRLTEVGSIRQSTIIGHECDRPRKYENIPYGGFYTQEDLREIVEFAARRCIAVVPEIDMPGHMAAAICAYPEWGNFPENHVPVRSHWGISWQILSPKAEVIAAMKDILGEIMDIFPGRYIHIGGDEARTDEWEICPEAQAIMAEHNCRSERDLQHYFTAQIQDFIQSRGRRMIGWEEILSPSLCPESCICSWRNKGKETEAALQCRYAVVANQRFAYFDYYQADPRYEPTAGGEFLPAEMVYQFRPLPDSLPEENRRYILGGQGQLWSEYIPSLNHLEYMAFPRSCALAEKLWTPERLCRWPDFLKRLHGHRLRLEQEQVHSCPVPGGRWR